MILTSFASILGLLKFRGPMTVVGSIISVVIFSIYGVQSAWSSAHIREKVSIGVQPSITYSNSPTTVVGITRNIGVVASVSNASPDGILSGVSVAMSSVSKEKNGSSTTPARFSVTVSKTRAVNFCRLSANTVTQVSSVISHRGQKSNYSEFSKHRTDRNE